MKIQKIGALHVKKSYTNIQPTSLRNLKKVDCLELKFHISRGVIGIIEYASYVNGRSVDSSLMRSEFLEDYKKNCMTRTELVSGMDFLLSELENMSICFLKEKLLNFNILKPFNFKNFLISLSLII